MNGEAMHAQLLAAINGVGAEVGVVKKDLTEVKVNVATMKERAAHVHEPPCGVLRAVDKDVTLHLKAHTWMMHRWLGTVFWIAGAVAAGLTTGFVVAWLGG